MTSKHFLIASIIGLVGTVSFFNVNSAWADSHRFNGLFVAGGIICYAVAIGWIGYNYIKQGGNPNKG